MTKFLRIALLLTVPLATGCGQVVGKLIPPQTFNNPANLDGAQLSSSSTLQPAAVKGTIAYDTSKTAPPTPFADLQYPENVPFGVRPHAMKLQAQFTQAVVQGSCSFPAAFQLTVQRFDAAVSDASGNATLSVEPKLTVTLTKTSGTATSATYSISDHTVTVSANAATTSKAINILTSGGQNNASATAHIVADQDGLAGCTVQFTLGKTSLTLSDFS